MNIPLLYGLDRLSKSISLNQSHLTYGIIGSSVAGIATVGALGGAKMYDYLRSETAPNVELVDNHILNEKVKEVVKKDEENVKTENIKVEIIPLEKDDDKYVGIGILIILFSLIIIFIKSGMY